MIDELYKIIEGRKAEPVPDSYTNSLFDSGFERIAQKVGEEAIEVVVAAGHQGKQRIIEEASDLIYHLFVLLVSQEITFTEIEKELERRHTTKKEEN